MCVGWGVGNDKIHSIAPPRFFSLVFMNGESKCTLYVDLSISFFFFMRHVHYVFNQKKNMTGFLTLKCLYTDI